MQDLLGQVKKGFTRAITCSLILQLWFVLRCMYVQFVLRCCGLLHVWYVISSFSCLPPQTGKCKLARVIFSKAYRDEERVGTCSRGLMENFWTVQVYQHRVKNDRVLRPHVTAALSRSPC